MSPELEHYIQLFLTSKAATREPATVSFYRVGLTQYALFAPDWPPTADSITGFLADCRQRGLSRYTVHDYYRALRAWLRWLHKRGVIDPNPIDLVDEPPRPKKVPRAPEVGVIEAFFEAIETIPRQDHLLWQRDRDRAIFVLLFDSGLRVGELCALTLSDLNLARREILIQDPKNDEERLIVFSAAAALTLAGWLDLRSSLGVPPECKEVFVSKPSRFNRWQPLSSSGVRQAKDNYLDRAGLSRFRVHDLRHAYAIYSLMMGSALTDIQQQLGHKNIATTAIYLQALNQGRADRHDASSPLRYLKDSD